LDRKEFREDLWKSRRKYKIKYKEKKYEVLDLSDFGDFRNVLEGTIY
jgi:hypothetical protein